VTREIRCPKCGAKTVIRTSKKDGRKFNECVNFPECQGRIQVLPDWERDEEIQDEGWGDEERPVAMTTREWIQQQSTMETKQSKQRLSKSMRQTERGSPLMILGILGLLLFVGSICILVYYWLFFDTTVPVSGLEDYGVSQVASLELRQQRQDATAICGLLITLSVFGIVVGYKAGKKKSD
jgi:hypothetical protein